jgi:hypothetical protein
MRLIYLIFAHKNCKQLFRLLEKLNGHNVQFLLHISKNCEKGFFSNVKKNLKIFPNCRLIKRELIRWGDFGLIKATLTAIRLVCHENFDFLIILSGQDYPIKSNVEIERALTGYKGKSLMEYFTLPTQKWDGGMERINRFHFWIGRRHYRYKPVGEEWWKRLVVRLVEFMKFSGNRRLPDEFVPYGGSFWSCLSSEAIYYLHNYLKTDSGKKIINFYSKCFHPSEMFLQTLLMNSRLSRFVVNLNVQFVKFNKLGRSQIITTNDFDLLMASDHLFTRRVDIDKDIEILNRIDRYIDKK